MNSADYCKTPVWNQVFRYFRLRRLWLNSSELKMKETLRKSLGIVIKRRRETLALSQDQLSLRSDLHRTYISDVERGERNLSFESIYSLSKGLGVLPSLLFAEAELDAYKSAGETLSGQQEGSIESANPLTVPHGKAPSSTS